MWLSDIVALDEDGRIGLGDAVFLHEWDARSDLVIDLGGTWLRVTEAPRRHRTPSVRLDAKHRFLAPLPWTR
jgi:hypothetical protein